MLRPYEKTNPESPLCANRGSFFADVFVPDGRIILDVIGEQSDAFLRVEIDDFNVEGAEPVDAALEGAGFADDDAGKTELANEAAAIPARRERGDHCEFAVAALAAGAAEGVGFSVEGGITELHPAIVAGAEQRAVLIEDGGADGDATFGEAFAGFGESDGEHGGMVEGACHLRNYTRTEFQMASQKSSATLCARNVVSVPTLRSGEAEQGKVR